MALTLPYQDGSNSAKAFSSIPRPKEPFQVRRAPLAVVVRNHLLRLLYQYLAPISRGQKIEGHHQLS